MRNEPKKLYALEFSSPVLLVPNATLFQNASMERPRDKRKGGLRAREWDSGGHWLSGGNCNHRARFWRTDQAHNWNPVYPRSSHPADRGVIPLLSLQFFCLLVVVIVLRLEACRFCWLVYCPLKWYYTIHVRPYRSYPTRRRPWHIIYQKVFLNHTLTVGGPRG